MLVDNSDDIQIDIKNKQNMTPLMIACQYGLYDIAEYLINKGASMLELRRTKKK